jgi:hypothetical protein
MVPAMIGRLLAAVLFLACVFAPAANAQSTARKAQVVVELFTSQGCTQCPRANRLLGMFSREDGVLALTFPVGIWDYLGWRDTLAQPPFSDRQRAYSQTLHVRGRFTPQLVFNGANQISASYWDEARAAIEQAHAAPVSEWPPLSLSRLSSNRARVAIGRGARRPDADVWLVAFDPGPVAVYITRGVNVNRRIYHYNLVRTIDRIGGWNGEPVYYERSRCTPECAVIVQEPNGGRILAAAFTSRER